MLISSWRHLKRNWLHHLMKNVWLLVPLYIRKKEENIIFIGSDEVPGKYRCQLLDGPPALTKPHGWIINAMKLGIKAMNAYAWGGCLSPLFIIRFVSISRICTWCFVLTPWCESHYRLVNVSQHVPHTQIFKSKCIWENSLYGLPIWYNPLFGPKRWTVPYLISNCNFFA